MYIYIYVYTRFRLLCDVVSFFVVSVFLSFRCTVCVLLVFVCVGFVFPFSFVYSPGYDGWTECIEWMVGWMQWMDEMDGMDGLDGWLDGSDGRIAG